jgi:S-methylmethionine-dependent homocysteine/selenocysteine methylase
MLVSGCIGPRGDGYDPGRLMTAEAAGAYHAHQAEVLAGTGPDLISALTINNLPEAIGVVRAVAATAMPMVLSFTTETDGCLPTGEPLGEAIAAVDEATGGYPAWYMVNCAHPTHFAHQLDGDWVGRLGAIRANASRLSHAELEVMETLDAGDPEDLGGLYAALLKAHPQIRVLGGCCGTDVRHVAAIAQACAG